jgi:hypothetical protein
MNQVSHWLERALDEWAPCTAPLHLTLRRLTEASAWVFDSNGSLIDSIAERRTMDSNADAGGVLQYGWTEGCPIQNNKRGATGL